MLCTCGNKLTTLKKDYKYIESGLDNIVFIGIPVFECKQCGEEFPEIKNIELIHNIIAFILVKKESLLNGKEIKFIRKQMGLNEKDFAALISVDPVSVSRWENLKSEISITNDKLIRMLFIQKIEEECNKVASDVLQYIKSIRKDARPASRIKIPYENISNKSFCLTF